ncbi:MAG: DUF2752 domain-containing protein [Arenimonas sp.]
MRVHAWWLALPFAVLVLLGIYLLRTYDPNVAGNPFLACMFHKLTGLYCPGCGLTRAMHALVHFDLLRAIRMNAFFMLSSPIIALLIWRLFRPLPKVLEAIVKPLANPWPWVVAVPLFAVLRNLPWYPFYLLAPIA